MANAWLVWRYETKGWCESRYTLRRFVAFGSARSLGLSPAAGRGTESDSQPVGPAPETKSERVGGLDAEGKNGSD